MGPLDVVVTGASGFIGRRLADRLQAAGHTVRGFDRVDGHDVRDPVRCRKVIAGADAVIHLAGVLGTAELFDRVPEAVDINISGTVNVLDACRDTDAAYVGITMPDVFPSVYTATKVCATRLASAYHQAYNLRTCHVRAFNVFGPGQAHGPGHPRKLVPALSCDGWAGRPLHIWGDGTQTVDLIHVDALADIFTDALAVTDDSTIDGGTGTNLSVNEVANIVLAETGSSAGVEYHPMRRGEVPTFIRAEGEGWGRLRSIPRFSADDLRQVIRSYRDHPAARRAA